MATFNDISLPVEVITTIIDYTYQTDLVSLARVCKTFQRIAQPRLYSSIDLRRGGHPGLPSRRINNMFRAVLGSPYLASLIRKVQLGCTLSYGYRIVPDLTASEYKLVHKMICDLQILSADIWAPSLESRGKTRLDVPLACLLYSLPYMEVLELDDPFDEEMPVSVDIMRSLLRHHVAASTSRKALCVLKRIHWFLHSEPNRDNKRPEMSEFLCLFYLPAVQTIKAVVLEAFTQFSWPASAPMTSTLTALHLCRSHVKEETLEELFFATPFLRTFEYNFYCDVESNPPGRSHLDCAKLAVSLRKLVASLETLIISATFVWHRFASADMTQWGIKGHLGPLHEFSKLRTLYAPLVVLLGWWPRSDVRLASVLPADLSYFCCTGHMVDWDRIQWTREAIVEQFREYLDANTSLELQDLVLSTKGEPESWPQHMCAKIKAMCVEAGIWYEYSQG